MTSPHGVAEMPLPWRGATQARDARPPRSAVQVVRFSSLDRLAPLATQWDRLARGVPFRSWAWLSTWWRHYGEGQAEPRQRDGLYVLGVIDASGDLAGIAPWYAEHSTSRGRVLRALGSGEVCSDHLSVLCEPHQEESVAECLADWLTAAHFGRNGRVQKPHSDRWDLLELTAVDADDSAIRRLVCALAARDATVYRQPAPSCWRIDLPAGWEQYVGKLSKSHRKQLRRIHERLLATGRAVLHSVEREEDLSRAEAILVDLHGRRRQRLGQPGCFASPRFAAFHYDAMRELLRCGRLGLHWIELDGIPVAAEYQLVGGDTVYAYQSGIDPDALHHCPGALAHLATIRHAIQQGYRGFDFLRGDEPYKTHWRARPSASLELHVVPPSMAARWRHGVWRSGRGVRQWVKNGLMQMIQPRRSTASGQPTCRELRNHP